ncbi:MAG: spermidine synthase [Planctomycetota bacterium]|jgi:spermidine synthase
MARLQTSGNRIPSRRHLLVTLLLGLGVWVCWPSLRTEAQGNFGYAAPGVTELEVKSEFSHIIVRRQRNHRSLIFVHDDGMEVLESKLDLDRPHRLLLPYTRYMFASYLLRPKQEHVLIVGLGGGSMVHFLKRNDPELRVDVVEIDPMVVKIADKYFGTRSGGKVRILLDDASKYLTTTPQRYGVIYMDAFLKPSQETDISGVPLRLKTVQFLKRVQKKLKPGGLMVFNVHLYDDTKETLAAIRSAFPQVYVFQVSHRRSLVVVGSLAEEREKPADLRLRARQLDRRFRASFSFQRLAKDLEPIPEPLTPGSSPRKRGEGRSFLDRQLAP